MALKKVVDIFNLSKAKANTSKVNNIFLFIAYSLYEEEEEEEEEGRRPWRLIQVLIKGEW